MGDSKGSGLYTLLFGTHSAADRVLEILGLRKRDLARFRDVHVHAGEVAVYTRLGGGNRPDYADTWAYIRASPHYLRDADDGFDSTYATAWFRFPEEHAAELAALEVVEPWDPDRRWKEKLAQLESAPREQVEKLAERMHEHVRIEVFVPGKKRG